MARRVNRRKFLQQTAASGVGFWVAGGIALAADDKSPNGKLRIACVGVGGKGSSDVNDAAGVGDIVAICDIDENPLGKKFDELSKRKMEPKKYNDFRKMLEEMVKDIDAVTVSTPDHTHAPAAMMAMKMGKHVYVQKPLTHTVYEARQMRETATKMKVCTQMGNQGTAGTSLRRAAEIVQAGGLGKVTEVYVWTNRPIWPQAPGVTSRPKDTPECPKTVHWDLFLGPAPERPYNSAYHPFKWRGWWDYGTGALGDMACHTMNLPYMALKLGFPSSVSAECDPVNPETYPGWARVTFEFPARGDMPPVKLIWHEGRKDGVLVHPPETVLNKVLKEGQKLSGSGSILVGDKGTIYSPDDYGGTVNYLPGEIKDFKAEATLPRNNGGDGGMKKEWAEAIKANKPSIALSNFDYAAMLTETILLGNVAMRVQGKKLDWDGPNLKFTNDADATKFLHYEYRKGWTL